MYEQLSGQLSRPNQITFTKVNTDKQTQIAQEHNITASVGPWPLACKVLQGCVG